MASAPLRRGGRSRYEGRDGRDLGPAPPDPAMPPRRVPRPSPRRDARRPAKGATPGGGRSPRRLVAVASAAAVALGLGLAVAAGLAWGRDRPRRLLERAEAASLARDWPAAVAAWKAFNATGASTARTLLAEARSDLAIDRAADADRAFEAGLGGRPDPARSLAEAGSTGSGSSTVRSRPSAWAWSPRRPSARIRGGRSSPL